MASTKADLVAAETTTTTTPAAKKTSATNLKKDDVSNSKDAIVTIVEDEPAAGNVLSWRDIKCTLGTEPNRVYALKGVSGFAKPGHPLAILGASGAGKSTLCDIISKRKTLGTIEGELLLNGRKPDRFYEKRLGYVTADMSHISTMTVRETLMFAAEMRMPASSTPAERAAMVEKQINGLKLQGCADTPVGDELLRGLSSGEKKRLEVAIELVASPKVIFLDEPTSGLDDHGAKFTMELILEYARTENLTVVVVIHQPSQTVIELFESVMILGGGRVCFFGPYKRAEAFFANDLNSPTPAHNNTIEHYVEVVASDPAAASAAYEKSDLHASMMAELKTLSDPELQPKAAPHSKNIYERGFVDQFKLLFVRVCQRYSRNPSTSWGRILLSLILSFIYGMVFRNVRVDIEGLRNRGSLASVMAFIPAFVAGSAAPQFLEDRDLYIQEMKAAFYETPAYYLTYFIVESGIILITTVLQSAILFFMAGIDSGSFAAFVLMVMMQGLVSVAVTQFTGAFSKTLVQCYTALVAYGLVLFAFSGVQVNLDTLSPALSWIGTINYWRYSNQYLLYRTAADVVLDCSSAIVPVNMNDVIPAIAATVVGTVTNNTVANYNDTASVTQALGYLSAAAAFGNFNSSVLPYAASNAPDLASTIYASSPSVLKELAGYVALAQPLLNKNIDVTNNTVVSGLLAQIGGLGLWNDTLSFPKGIFPDYSYCAVGDAKKFLATNFGVKPDSGDNKQFGIMAGWLLLYMALTWAGLVFSQRYKKR